MSSKFFLLIKRDFLLFWGMSKIRLLNSMLLILIIMGITTYQIKSYLLIMGLSNLNVHFFDIYLYLFWGIEYSIVKTNHFNFPIIWLVLGLTPFYILGDAFKINIINYSLFLTGRSISKSNIFAIKSLVLCFLFIIYHLIIMMFSFINSLVFFNPDISIGDFLTSINNIVPVSNFRFFLFIIIQILSSISLLYLFNFLVLIMKSIYAMIIISLILFSTIYVPIYKILWINGTMFSRILEFNISEIHIIIIELFLICLFYFIGNIIYKNIEY